ncbi:MAG: GDSL-type esterase/lipase family protein [Limisphaerales bacterium]
MRKVVVILLLAVAAVVGWWLWPTTVHYVNLPPHAKGPWIAFGDSLTAGYGANPAGDYPTVLGKKLGVIIENGGRNGETSQDGLNRVESVVHLHPRVVLLCFGGNDALRQVPREETFRNLRAIVDRLQQQGTFVVLIGVRSATLRDKNAGWFEDLAREKHVLYVPNILDGVLTHPNMMSDEVHPNDTGYAFIAERIGAALEPVMPQLR